MSAPQLPSDAPPQVVQLGAPEQIHPSSTMLLWGLGITGLAAFGPAVACFAFLVKPFGQNPPPPAAALAGGCVFALMGLACLLSAILVRLPTWVVFPSALVQLKGSKAQIFLWDEIQELRQEALATPAMPGMAPVRYIVVARDGRKCEIETPVRDRQKLAARILEGLAGRRAPARAQAAAGLPPASPTSRPPRTGELRERPSTHRPGEPISKHEVTLGGLCRRYAAALMLGGIFLAMGIGGLALSITRPDALWPGVVLSAIGIPFFVPILMWGFGGPSEVTLLETGIRWKDDKGDHEAGWREVRELYQRDRIVNNTFRQTQLKFVLIDGREVAFDHRFSDYDRLADGASERYTDVCLARKRDELGEGRVNFGPISVDQREIRLRENAIPWGDMQAYTIWNGGLVFRTVRPMKPAETEFALGDIPNSFVLLMLLAEMGHPPVQPAAFFGRG